MKPRLTREDWSNIWDALMFIDAGDFPWVEETEEETQAHRESFWRTVEKVSARDK